MTTLQTSWSRYLLLVVSVAVLAAIAVTVALLVVGPAGSSGGAGTGSRDLPNCRPTAVVHFC